MKVSKLMEMLKVLDELEAEVHIRYKSTVEGNPYKFPESEGEVVDIEMLSGSDGGKLFMIVDKVEL